MGTTLRYLMLIISFQVRLLFVLQMAKWILNIVLHKVIKQEMLESGFELRQFSFYVTGWERMCHVQLYRQQHKILIPSIFN